MSSSASSLCAQFQATARSRGASSPGARRRGLECVLAAHPGVGRVAVIGVPDEKWGELATAVVVPAPSAGVGEAELIAWARERLAGYETPKRVVFTTAMPETVGGKIRKYELRAQLVVP